MSNIKYLIKEKRKFQKKDIIEQVLEQGFGVHFIKKCTFLLKFLCNFIVFITLSGGGRYDLEGKKVGFWINIYGSIFNK